MSIINQKNFTRQDKRQWINDLATKAPVTTITNNLRQLYQITKQLIHKKTKSYHRVKDNNGTAITDLEEQLIRLHE